MSAYLETLVQFVSAHPYLAYATVFLAALLEAVPVLGSFVPGSTVIIGLSAFVAAGDLQLAGVLASAVSGAVIGDGSAFLLGNFYQRRILAMWPLRSYPVVIARSEEFFAKHGTLAILLARFVPPVRAFVPITAGAIGMSARRFFPVNVIAISLWASAHVLPGALAGTLWKQYGREIEHIAMPVFAAAVTIWLGLWWWRRRQKATP